MLSRCHAVSRDVESSSQAGVIVSNTHVWHSAQERLRQQMTRAQFDTWLRGTWLSASADGVTTLCVRTTFAKEQLETRFRERIAAAISEVTGQSCVLRIVVSAGGAESGSEDEEALASSSRAHATQPRSISAASTLATRRAPHAHANGAASAFPSLFEAVSDTPVTPVPAPATSYAAAAQAAQAQEAQYAAASQEGTQKRVLVLPSQRRRTTPAVGGAGAARSERVRAALGRTRGVEAPAPSAAAASIPLTAEKAEDSTIEQGVRSDNAAPHATRPSARAEYTGENSLHTGGRRHAPARREQIGGSTTMNGYQYPRDDDEGRDATREEFSGNRLNNDNQLMPPRLNPRYTFSTFIVGSSNQLAHAASQAVAEAPGQSYNPLFLYGGVGLGKTHLLHAIGHTAIEHGLAVLYVSSETFTNEIINAIRYRTTEEFRAKYRSVDVLLVDDIQFIAGKESTEEEFFHTFNSLHDTSKQIVICSDRPPKAMISLQERLRSRFEWGLIADIQPPDLETRVAILRTKADTMGRKVPDDVVNYIASRVQSNIRELEGTFNRFFAFAQLQHLPLTIDTAKAALSNLAADGRQRRVTIAEILDAVAEYYRIPKEDLCGKQRDKHIVVPRQIAMFLMRQETEASLLEIGQSLGGRDHSTVLHGCEKIGREVNDNTTLRKEVMAIRQQLMGKE